MSRDRIEMPVYLPDTFCGQVKVEAEEALRLLRFGQWAYKNLPTILDCLEARVEDLSHARRDLAGFTLAEFRRHCQSRG
jgi:hypothetical protein